MSLGDVFGQAVIEQVRPKEEVEPAAMDEAALIVEINNELAKRSARLNAGHGSILPSWLQGWTIPCVLGGIVGGYFLTKYFKKN